MSRKVSVALLERFLDYKRVHCNASPRTLTGYRSSLRRFLAYLDEMRLSAVTQDTLEEFLLGVSATGVGPSSIAAHTVALRSFFRYLQERCKMSNPAARLRIPRQRHRLPTFLRKGEIERVLNAVDSVRNRAIVELFYATGIRLRELTSLNREDIDMQVRAVFVRSGKGGGDRWVPMGEPALEALRAYLAERGHPGNQALFLASSGKRLSASAVYKMICQLAQRAGVPSLRPHMLRHTCATHLLWGGADLRSIQTILGHKKLQTTEIYTHIASPYLHAVYADAHPRARLRAQENLAFGVDKTDKVSILK